MNNENGLGVALYDGVCRGRDESCDRLADRFALCLWGYSDGPLFQQLVRAGCMRLIAELEREL